MYRKDSLDELNKDFDFFKQNNCNLIPKLVRGAYYNQEKNENHRFLYPLQNQKCWVKDKKDPRIASQGSKPKGIGALQGTP